MANKKLTVMLISGSREQMRQFRISRYLIIGIAAAFIILFINNIFLTASYFNSQSDAYEMARLRAENENLVI